VNRNTLVRFAYETARNPQKRRDFIKTFASIIDANAAAIAVEDHQLRWAMLPDTHGMDQGTVDGYRSLYVGLNPWAVLRGRNSNIEEVRISDELLSEKELRQTEFYHGWMRDRGWMHASSIVVQVTETYRAYIFAMRPPGDPFTVRERLILNDLAPDLAVAAQIGKDLADQRDTINRLRSGAREFDILRAQGLKHDGCLIALALFQGQHIKEIAAKNNRSHDSVKWHVKAIYRTLGVHNRAEFMRRLNGLFRQ
jgi:hypothetical protein